MLKLRVTGGGSPLKGCISLPGDKSISHRAALIGAIADGRTKIKNYSTSIDCLTTLNCLRNLGVEIEGPDARGNVSVYGKGLRGLKEPDNCLYAGNSGTTARLLMGILVGQKLFAVLTGDPSLRSRPMKRITGPLKQMGAFIDGKSGAGRLPLTVRGTDRLTAIDYRLPTASAQVKSALLLAGLFAVGETTVREIVKSRDHTERMLRHFGAKIKIHIGDCGRENIVIQGCRSFQGRELSVPGDISSASFFIVGATIVNGSKVTIKDVGLNPTRTGIVDVLRQMGADISVFNKRIVSGEPLADLEVRASPLRGVRIQGEVVPRLIDELPVIAVAAAFADGVTVIKDAGELRLKESDRIQVIAGELKKFGAEVAETEDGLVIGGGKALAGAVCDSHGDHRIAMSMAIAGTACEGETIVKGAECIDISCPGFADVLKTLREE